MQVIQPICLECKHYDEFSILKMTCKAFPNGIPDKYKLSESEHRSLINGYKFEKINK